MKILFSSIFLLVFTTLAQAQTTIAVDITRAKFTWTWTQGSGGAVAAFRMKCGATAGNYTLLVSIPDPAARSLALSDVVTSPGKYFCTISAANAFGESPNSNEVSFDAGIAPAAPAGLSIQAQ